MCNFHVKQDFVHIKFSKEMYLNFETRHLPKITSSMKTSYAKTRIIPVISDKITLVYTIYFFGFLRVQIRVCANAKLYQEPTTMGKYFEF